MKKTITCIVSAAIIFLLVSGCESVGYGQENVQPPRGVDVSTYYFNTWNENFRTMQDDGFVSVFENKSATHEGVTLRVIAIVSDGLTAYVRIAADGQLPPGLVVASMEFPHLIDEIDEEYINLAGGSEIPSVVSLATNHITEAVLSNDEGGEWNFRAQLAQGTNGSYHTIRPTLHDPSLNKNEDILVFHNTEFLDTTTLSIEIIIRGIDELFVIENLEVTPAPIDTRELSEYNLAVRTEFADFQLLSVMSTYLDTIFTIQWEVHPGFSSAHPFFNRQMLVFEWKDGVTSTFMFRPDDSILGDESIEFISNHATIAYSLQLNEEIVVSVVDIQTHEYIETLFVIPPLV